MVADHPQTLMGVVLRETPYGEWRDNSLEMSDLPDDDDICGLHLVLFRYREMNRAKLSEVNFGIKRLMEDLGKRMIINDIAADIANWKSFSDSGHSTLPGDDCDDLGR